MGHITDLLQYPLSENVFHTPRPFSVFFKNSLLNHGWGRQNMVFEFLRKKLSQANIIKTQLQQNQGQSSSQIAFVLNFATKNAIYVAVCFGRIAASIHRTVASGVVP